MYLDKSDIERLAAALPAHTTPVFLAEMKRGLTDTCEAVIETTERSWRCAPSASEAEVRALLDELGARVAALIPYGILSKFVPDALYEVLKSSGDTDDPPFPVRSPATELTREAASLYVSCRARGFSPDRLMSEWPDVPAEVASLVGREFCRGHTGFGPLAWEAAGYEDPRYVFGILAGIFTDDDPEVLLLRLGPTPAIPGRCRPSLETRRCVTFWRSGSTSWIVKRGT